MYKVVMSILCSYGHGDMTATVFYYYVNKMKLWSCPPHKETPTFYSWGFPLNCKPAFLPSFKVVAGHHNF